MYGIPCSSAAARYIAKRIGAGELMVIDVVTDPTSIPLNSVSMSSTESTATPQRPTSPSACGESESWPMRVGMSNATDSPIWPWASRNRYRSLVSRALPNPANWRIVQTLSRYMVRCTPRVYG